MPPTRVSTSDTAGRLRIPYVSIAQTSSRQRRTRNAASQSEASGSQDLLQYPQNTSSIRRGSRNNAASRSHRDLSSIHEDTQATPRARDARHSRTRSLASTATSVLHSPQDRPAKRRLHVRPSLTGAQVEEMTIERRAEVVADVAGDCLVKLLRAGLRGDELRKGGDEWRKAWDGLKTLRSTYIFPEYSPPFPLLTDLISSFHPRVQSSFNPATLHRAVSLSNLSTFIWAILQPNEAWEMEEDGDDVSENGRTKRRVADVKRIKRRNRMLLLAWKRFWMVVVPREKRSSERALRLWLDFATQIQLVAQHPTVDPPSSYDPSLPPAPPTQIQDLFSPSAVGRYGQWEVGEDWDSLTEDTGTGEKGNVERRWGTLAQRREKELRELEPEVLARRYPYDIFRQEMLAFVERDILGSIAYFRASISRAVEGLENDESDAVRSDLESIASTTPRRHLAVVEMPMQVDGDTLDFRSDTASETEQPNDLLGPLDEQEELDLTGGSMGDEEADDPLQLDMFAEIAMELEQDGIEDSSIGRQRRSHSTMSPQKKRTAFVNVDEEEWAVRDFAGLRNIDPIQHELSARRFHFAAPQGDAVQVDWESQSPAHWRASLTPRVRFGSRLDASVAATTPRSILRSPQPDGSPRSNDHGKPTASALRSQHVNSSPRSPSSLPRHMILPLRSDSSTHTAMPRVSLNPAAELISYRMERTPSVSKQSAAADDEAEEDELLEDADLQDLLPDIPQLRGDVPQSSNEPRTPLDANIADLLPDLPHAKHGEEPGVVDEMDPIQGLGMDFFVPEGLPALAVRAIPTVSDPVIDLNHALPIGTLPVSANGIDSLYQGNVAPPTSQRAIVSPRPRNSRETQEFATPDPREDQEDWQSLSDLTAQGLPRRTTWRTANSAAPSIKQSPGSPDLLRPDVPRVIHRGPRRAREMTGEDLYLVDADRTPLESDPNYIIPRNHVAKRSRIHGQVEGQSTSYSRLSGRRKWTQAEEILLYRTIQKVPLSGEYPLRVVWFLHGEYGTLSHDLEQFNPQHMKDKMRVIVNARANNRRPVTGRARFFLPGNHPDKLAFNEEMNELRFRGKSVFPTMASEKDELDSDEDKAEEEDYDDLDELVSEVEAEHASPLPKRRKRTRAASKAAPNGHVETEQASPSPKRVKWTRAGSSAVASGHVEAEQASTSGRRRKRSRAGTFVAADSHFISSQAINKTPAKPVGESPAKPRTSSGRLEKEFVQLRQDRERVSPGPARRSTRSIKANDRASRYAARKLAAVRAEAEEEDVSEEPVGTKSDRKGRLKAQVNGDGPEPLFIPVEDDDEVAGEDHLDGKGEEALGLIHGIGEDDGEDVVRREMVKRRVLGIA